MVRKLATQNIKTETDEVRLDGVLDEFRTALQEEIQAARVFEYSNAVQLKNGRRIAKIGKNFQYLFEIENALNLPDDTPGDLLIPDNPPINVMIVSIEGLVITVSMPEDIGSFVPIARLKSNLTYLLIRLIERIESYANKSNPVGDRIIGAHPISGSEPAIELPESYNNYQKSAVASSVGRNTTFIWGPPGTGKTQTIGEIGFQLYKRKRSIILVSHTNTAVDQAIIRIGKKIYKDDLENGKAIRVGNPKDERLREEPNLLLETHVTRRSEKLANKRDELKNELEKGSYESIELARLIDLCEWVKSSKASIQIMADTLQEIQKVENEIIGLKSQISQTLKNRGFWREAITKAKQINEIIRNNKRIDNDLQDIKNQIYELEKLLDYRTNEISEEKKILSEAKSFGWLTRRWKRSSAA